jgi:hypothetical protein
MKASAKRIIQKILAVFLCVFYVLPLPYFPIRGAVPLVNAASTSLTSRADFQAGTFTNTEATSKEGEIKLSPDGTWGPRVFHTPNLSLSDQSAVTSDGEYIYLINSNDNHFSRYNPVENRWKTLASAPHYAYVGTDLVVSGNYIYAIFGGYQKEFARYTISTNTWTAMTSLPDLVANGASLATDDTSIYLLRSNGTTDFWKYTISTNTWSTITSPPATISSGSSLYYTGGYLYTPRGGGTQTLYRYNISAGTWTTLANAPGTLNEDHTIDGSGDYIYVTRDQGTQTFYKYRISTDAWSTIANTPQTSRYVGVVYHSGDGYLYVFRGNGTYDFWKYNTATDAFLGPTDLPATPGTGADMIYSGGLMYYLRGNGTANFYSYNVSTGAWTTLTSAPATFGDDNKGVLANGKIYFMRGSSTQTFYVYDIAGGTWTALANTPATISYGGTLTYPGSGDYLYATRGALTRSFYRYSISGNTWDDAGAADLPDDAEAGYGSRLISNGTDVYYISGSGIARLMKYTVGTNTWSVLASLPFSPLYGVDATFYSGKIYATAGYYKKDLWEYSISGDSWRQLPNIQGNYNNDVGPYNGASLESDGGGTMYFIYGANFTYMHSFVVSTYNYVASGSWRSDVMDLTYVNSWTSLTASVNTPSDSSITYETRSSTDRTTWSGWQAVSGGVIASPARRYLQVRATFNPSTGRTATPTLYSLSVNYAGDSTAPANPSTVTAMSQSVGGVSLSSGNNYSYAYPYFSWTGASDTETAIAGYYVYFGSNSTADPQVSGNLQTVNTYSVTTPMTNGTYYLRLKTVDSAGNISAALTGFTYIYAGVSPQSVTATSTSDFSAGTASNITTTNNKLALSPKAGFWQQERLSLAPAGFNYGASFAYVSATNKLYTLRGAGSTTFYEYNITTDTWTTKAAAPAAVNNGGSLIEGPSGYLYAARGQNTTTFWRYDIANDTWSDAAAADAPQPFDYGASLVYDGSRYVYGLKGNNDDTFMRYDTQVDTWEVLANVDFRAPTEQINNLVYNGGDLAYDGGNTVYAIQGGTRSGFASYSISTGTWSQLTNVPSLANYGAQIEFDATTNAVYYTPGWDRPFMYKYSLDTQTWTELAETPLVMSSGTAMRLANGYIYIVRGGGSNVFYRYNIAKNSWLVPTRGIISTIFRGTEYLGFNYGADIVKGDGNNLYLTGGNYSSVFMRYNSVTGEMTALADVPAGVYQGGDIVYDSVNNKIYATVNSAFRKMYVYDVATDTWSELTNDPPPVDVNVGATMVFDGSRYIYIATGNAVNFYRFDTQGSAGSRWVSRANLPASVGYGSDLVLRGNYIYATRGNNTLSFYRYDIGANTWSDPAVADLPAGATIYNDGFMVDSGGDLLYACRGANTNTCYSYSISGNTWTAIAAAPANITAGGAAATNGTDKIFVIAGAGTNTYGNGLYTYVMQTSNSSVEESGSYISATHDLGSVYRFANISLTYNTAANNTISVLTRTSADNSTWSAWTAASENKSIGTSYSYKINSAVNRYLQVKFLFTSSDGVYSSSIDDYTINYYQDTVSPTNPSSLTAYSSATMSANLTTNTWYNYSSPYFDWPDAEAAGGATDTATGSGVLGYYVYFGTSTSADPLSDGTFATSSAYLASGLSSGETYYLKIKAKDDAGNVASSSWSPFIYKFDNTAPINPSTIIANPPGYTATNSFDFSWSGASDSASLISEYCYKTGASGATDTCTSVASASAVLAYQTGTNTFYVRAKDTAGNYASDYATSSYYYNSTAPSPPRNLTVSPESNTLNEFSFTWEPPLTYYGTQSDLRYYYSINELPKSSNVNKIGLSSSYLSADAYATKKGVNTLYVVAKDGAGNIDYNLYASVDFTADTAATGNPTGLDISDVSIKETKNWKLAITWDAPTATGSGIASYKVYRSATTGASCSTDSTKFSYIASTIQTSFVDSSLTQEKHYYCVKACDSTNECSAVSDTVSLLPDGKWRIAPDQIASSSAIAKTRSATISWSTNRTANSFVKHGKKSGDYGDEVGSSDQVTYHEIKLTSLDPGITYYYQMSWTDEDGNTGKSEEMTFDTQAAPFISSVKVMNVSINSAYVTFKVKDAIKSTVQYGKTLGYGASETLSTAKAESTYTIQLANLTDATAYHLRIVAEDEEGNIYNGDDYTFDTLPVPKILNAKVQQVAGMPTATLRLLWSSNTPITSVVTYYPKANPEQAKDSIALALKKSHELVLKDLRDDTEYVLAVKGKDSAGNEAAAPVQTVKTAVDFRAPEILNMNVESTIVGVGEQAKAQIIVSWDTDEPATTQVEYAEGTGATYTHSTQEDTNMTTNHVVTIPGLSPSKIYHLRAVSKDKAANSGQSPDTVIITPKSTKDALNLVIENLSKTFGFLKGVSLTK